MKRAILFQFVLGFMYVFSYAQPGTLDQTFGTSGVYLSDENVVNYGIDHMAMDITPDDKIVGIGHMVNGLDENMYVSRVNADGTLDTSFNFGMGYVQYDVSIGGDDLGVDVKVQPDGKILCVGYSDLGTSFQGFIVRLNTDGTYDQSFANGTGFITYQYNNKNTFLADVVLDSQGRIIVTGRYAHVDADRGLILRFNSDGSIDNTFSNDGAQEIVMIANNGDESVGNVAAFPDNSLMILLRNYGGDVKCVIAKVTESGNLDVSYGDQGKFIYQAPANSSPQYFGFDLLADGSVLFCGTEDDQGLIIKLKSNGSLDSTFSSDGKILLADMKTIHDIKQFTSDRFAFVGSKPLNQEYVVGRMNIDGNLDFTFGTQGLSTFQGVGDFQLVYPNQIAFQSSGNIICAGTMRDGLLAITQEFYTRIYNPGFSSINEEKSFEFSMYPNPTSEYFMIDIPSGNITDNICLLDINGRKLCSWTGHQNQYALPILSNGTYFIQVHTNNGIAYKQMVISNR